jgi:predicted dienelactone hydrolase
LAEYVASALFVYTEESSKFIDPLQDNAFGVDITPIPFDELQRDPTAMLDGAEHVVVSGGYAT